MTLEHFHSSGKIPVVIERLKIQQTEEAHSRRSLAEILSKPVAFHSHHLDNKAKTLGGSVVFRSNLCSVSTI